jgi:hypothetical protein
MLGHERALAACPMPIDEMVSGRGRLWGKRLFGRILMGSALDLVMGVRPAPRPCLRGDVDGGAMAAPPRKGGKRPHGGEGHPAWERCWQALERHLKSFTGNNAGERIDIRAMQFWIVGASRTMEYIPFMEGKGLRMRRNP